MRIERIDTPKGRVYKIYCTSDGFVEQMRGFVPLILASRGDVFIGGTDGDPDLVLSFGPVDSESEARFERRVKHML